MVKLEEIKKTFIVKILNCYKVISNVIFGLFLSLKRQVKKIFLFVITLIIPPLIFIYLLFPITNTINLSSGIGGTPTVVISLSDKNFRKPSWKSAIADAISLPLQLKWYDVYLKNTSHYSNTTLGYIADSGTPLLLFGFIKGSPELYGQVTSPDKGCDEYKLKDGMFPFGKYCLATQQTAHFLYSGDEELTLNMVFMSGGKPLYEYDISKENVVEANYELYATYNKTAWFAKLFFIFLFWVFFLSSMLGIWDFISKK